MIAFFIVFFVGLGIIFGAFLKEKTAWIVIVVTSIMWFFIFGPWSFATFVELTIGYFIGKNFNVEKSEKKDNEQVSKTINAIKEKNKKIMKK